MGRLLVRLLLSRIIYSFLYSFMRRGLLIFCVLCFVSALSAKRVVVMQKTSEPYMRNMTLNCEYKMQHKDVEIVNHLKYIEVKKGGATKESLLCWKQRDSYKFIAINSSPNW